MLDLQGLTRRFGALVALDHLSFSVPAGQVVGFLAHAGERVMTAQPLAWLRVSADA